MSTKNTFKWFVTLLAVGAGTTWLLKRRGDDVCNFQYCHVRRP